MTEGNLGELYLDIVDATKGQLIEGLVPKQQGDYRDRLEAQQRNKAVFLEECRKSQYLSELIRLALDVRKLSTKKITLKSPGTDAHKRMMDLKVYTSQGFPAPDTDLARKVDDELKQSGRQLWQIVTSAFVDYVAKSPAVAQTGKSKGNEEYARDGVTIAYEILKSVLGLKNGGTEKKLSFSQGQLRQAIEEKSSVALTTAELEQSEKESERSAKISGETLTMELGGIAELDGRYIPEERILDKMAEIYDPYGREGLYDVKNQKAKSYLEVKRVFNSTDLKLLFGPVHVFYQAVEPAIRDAMWEKIMLAEKFQAAAPIPAATEPARPEIPAAAVAPVVEATVPVIAQEATPESSALGKWAGVPAETETPAGPVEPEPAPPLTELAGVAAAASEAIVQGASAEPVTKSLEELLGLQKLYLRVPELNLSVEAGLHGKVGDEDIFIFTQ